MNDIARYERFMQLFLPMQRAICVYLRSLVPNRTDAEDVLQAAATVMWERFDDFQPGTRFDQWAYQIARFQALRYLKERKRDKLVFSDEVLDLIADRAATVSGDTNDALDALELCVERLTDQNRELLRMRFEPGATNRSVAGAVGRPERTVSRNLSQLYDDLLRCIQQRALPKKQGERQ